ncbi:MAG: AAA family ATPase [Oscillospiraceae bacterium]|nr:AAA family ATPase [Oscillospiraceae bacterium]
MGKVLAFVSGKGGTGKTSTCAAVASCLSAMGDRVLCIDLDVGLRNLDLSLGMGAEPLLPFTDLVRGDYELDQIEPNERLSGLKMLSAPVTIRPEEIDEAAFGRFLDRCREAFDWCLLDAPAGIGAGFRLSALFADECIVVTGGDVGALRDGAAAAVQLRTITDAPARVLVNRVSPKLMRKMQKTVDDVMDTVGLPLLGIVPEDSAVPLASAKDTPLVLYEQSGAARACLRIARRIKGIKTPLTAK